MALIVKVWLKQRKYKTKILSNSFGLALADDLTT